MYNNWIQNISIVKLFWGETDQINQAVICVREDVYSTV